MHKFYWNNTHRASSANGGGITAPASTGGPATTSSGVKITEVQSSCDFPSVNMHTQQHPEVPLRANLGSCSIKVGETGKNSSSNGSSAATAPPSGSHRVLLKLKKMSASASGQNRPKSMHESFTSSANSCQDGPQSTTSESENGNVKKSKLPSSRSMVQFYNRTWNERSLSKYQHNYENVYSNYENVYGN